MPIARQTDVTPITVAGQRSACSHPAQSLAHGAGDTPAARSLYVHVPFCRHKCHYCDFYSIVDSADRQDAFVDRLTAELAALAPLADTLRTVFVGGGTPTLLGPHLWERILDCLHHHYRLTDAEFTVECNPETSSAALFGVLAGGGVNRISIGAQSFDRRLLAVLERRHEPASVGRTVDLARAAGIDRLSVDMIYAIPGQSPADWARDLRAALGLGLEHLSAYTLTYEPNTAMTRRLELGQFEPADEDTELAMMRMAEHAAEACGLTRYEVSNFARPGRACRHNLAYWRQEPWLAAGPSASGHLGGWRWKNTPRLGEYLDSARAGPLPPVVDVEPPDPRRALAERIMTGLRLDEGLDARSVLADARAIAGPIADALASRAGLLVSRGLLADGGGRWSLTARGLPLADGLAAELMSLLAGPGVGVGAGPCE